MVCHIENSSINIKQNKKLVVCLLKEEPFDKDVIAIEVHIIANIPKDIVTKPIAISVSTTILKIATNPPAIAMSSNNVAKLFFILFTKI